MFIREVFVFSATLAIFQATACAQCSEARAVNSIPNLPICSRVATKSCAEATLPAPVTSSKLAPGRFYKIVNCSPSPKLTTPLKTCPVQVSPTFKPIIVLAADIQTPKTIGSSASCLKSFLQPQNFLQLLSAPLLSKLFQTAAKPTAQVVAFKVQCPNSCGKCQSCENCATKQPCSCSSSSGPCGIPITAPCPKPTVTCGKSPCTPTVSTSSFSPASLPSASLSNLCRLELPCNKCPESSCNCAAKQSQPCAYTPSQPTCTRPLSTCNCNLNPSCSSKAKCVCSSCASIPSQSTCSSNPSPASYPANVSPLSSFKGCSCNSNSSPSNPTCNNCACSSCPKVEYIVEQQPQPCASISAQPTCAGNPSPASYPANACSLTSFNGCLSNPNCANYACSSCPTVEYIVEQPQTCTYNPSQPTCASIPSPGPYPANACPLSSVNGCNCKSYVCPQTSANCVSSLCQKPEYYAAEQQPCAYPYSQPACTTCVASPAYSCPPSSFDGSNCNPNLYLSNSVCADCASSSCQKPEYYAAEQPQPCSYLSSQPTCSASPTSYPTYSCSQVGYTAEQPQPCAYPSSQSPCASNPSPAYYPSYSKPSTVESCASSLAAPAVSSTSYCPMSYQQSAPQTNICASYQAPTQASCSYPAPASSSCQYPPPAAYSAAAQCSENFASRSCY